MLTRSLRFLLPLTSLCLAASWLACSSDDPATFATGGAGGDDATTTATGMTTATATSTVTSTVNTGVGGSCDVGQIPSCVGDRPDIEDDWFCEQTPAIPDCPVAPDHTLDLCGVPLKAPTGEVSRSSTAIEHGGTGPVDNACLVSGVLGPEASQKVTMSGVVTLFKGGCSSTDVLIQVRAVKRGCTEDDGALAGQIGSPVTTASDCQADSVAVADGACGTKYLCRYAYKNVPTETELVVRTSGTGWTPVYEYNVYLHNADVTNGAATHDAVALSEDGYAAIVQSGLGAAIPAMHGSIIGEVRDCGGVRLQNAVVDVDLLHTAQLYFNGDEASPLPDLAATGTDAIGRFAILDLLYGEANVAAVGSVGGTVVPLGFTRTHVYPGSVTFVAIQGLFPGQIGP